MQIMQESSVFQFFPYFLPKVQKSEYSETENIARIVCIWIMDVIFRMMFAEEFIRIVKIQNFFLLYNMYL